MPFKILPPNYGIWQGMLRRCFTKTNAAYKDYGARGITVCERWLTYENFAKDMGERPISHTLERINNNGNYEPNNCRWATKKEQQRNRRINIKVVIEGREYLAIELAEKAGLKTDSIIARAKHGLTMEEIISPNYRRNLSGLALGGDANGAKKRAQTHCPQGHEYTEENTHVCKNGWRHCRTCHRERMRLR